MTRQPQWKINIALDDDAGTTRAQISLDSPAGSRFVGVGLVQRGQRGRVLTEIATELAIARALGDLTEELLEAAGTDVESSMNTTPSARHG